jgi:hypothetical protein
MVSLGILEDMGKCVTEPVHAGHEPLLFERPVVDYRWCVVRDVVPEVWL